MADPIRTPAEALEAAAQDAQTHPEADRRICCNGDMCGCYGATIGDVVAYSIRALASRIPPAPNDEALVKIVAQALWEHAAMSFAPWCEAKALELERQGYVAEARAVLTALREAGALQ